MYERLLQGFHLGAYHVDPRSGRVSGPAGTHSLSPKASEVLLCLAARAPDVVTHEDISREAWGDESTHHDRVSHAVGELRKAFDDHANRPLYIQTLPRRGYRLLIQPGLDPPTALPTAGAPSGPVPSSGFFGSLVRRGVIEAGLAYLVIGWLLIQIANVTSEPLSLPGWVDTFVTYLVIVGFPIVLILAWFIRWTPHGVELDVDAETRPAQRQVSKTYIAIVGALALASVGVFAYDRYVGLPGQFDDVALAGTAVTESIAVDPNSIAVLPFRNIGESEEGRIFAEGLADDMIDRLTRIPALRVSSRGDSFTLPPNSASADVRQRLRVAYFLEGSVRLVDNTLRVVVQLIDSGTSFHIVSRSFDRDREDFFALQDELTELTVANLRVALPPDTRLIGEGDPTSVDAYVLYRRGMDALHEAPTAATIAQALDAFDAALAVDSAYAAAHAGVCMARAAGYEISSDADDIYDAERACASALDLNPNLDVVHNALGELYVRTGRYEDAVASFERALEINPKSVSSLIGLGDVYADQQALDEAEEVLRRAVGLQPGNWNAYNSLGSFLFQNGRYDEAASEFREVVALDIRNVAGWVNLAAASMLSGDFAEGIRASERSIEIEPTREAYANLGLLQSYIGDIDEAVASLESAVGMAPNDYLSWSILGDALSFSDTPARARDAFMRARELANARLQVNARDGLTLADLAWIEAQLGDLEDAGELMERARAAASADPQVNYIDGLILARRGETDGAVDKLASAVEMGYPRALIAADPRLSSVASDARFVLLTNEPAEVAQGSP